MDAFLQGFYTILGGLCAIPLSVGIIAITFIGVCFLLEKAAAIKK